MLEEEPGHYFNTQPVSTQLSLPGGKCNQPSVNFTSHSCKTTCTYFPCFVLFFFGGRIGEGHNYLANIIPFEKLFKTQLIISVFCPHVAKDQNLSTFWNIPVLSGLLRTIAEFVHLSSES